MTVNPSGEADPLPIMVGSTYVTLTFCSSQPYFRTKKKDLSRVKPLDVFVPFPNVDILNISLCFLIFLTITLPVLIGL